MSGSSSTLAYDLAQLVIATINVKQRLPWTSETDVPLLAPSNPARRNETGAPRPYRGINFIVLLAHAMARDFAAPLYATRQQWWDETRSPVLAAALPHPAPVVYFLKIPHGSIPRLSSPVYNIAQTAQLGPSHLQPARPTTPLPTLQLIARAEAQMDKQGAVELAQRFGLAADPARHIIVDIAGAMTAAALDQPYSAQPHHAEMIEAVVPLLGADPNALLTIAAAAQRKADAVLPSLMEQRRHRSRVIPSGKTPSAG